MHLLISTSEFQKTVLTKLSKMEANQTEILKGLERFQRYEKDMFSKDAILGAPMGTLEEFENFDASLKDKKIMKELVSHYLL